MIEALIRIASYENVMWCISCKIVPSKDSDQPAQLCTLIRVFAVYLLLDF